MKRIVIVVTLALCLPLLSSPSAVAGVYADELAKCLVRSTTDADKTYLVRWLFASVSTRKRTEPVTGIGCSIDSD